MMNFYHADDDFSPYGWWKIIIRIMKNHHSLGHFLLCHYSSQDHIDHFQIQSKFKTSDDLQKILPYFRNLSINIPIFRVIRKKISLLSSHFCDFITFIYKCIFILSMNEFVHNKIKLSIRFLLLKYFKKILYTIF